MKKTLISISLFSSLFSCKTEDENNGKVNQCDQIFYEIAYDLKWKVTSINNMVNLPSTNGQKIQIGSNRFYEIKCY